jgi:D-alanyl-D-alanine carboxypeptidase
MNKLNLVLLVALVAMISSCKKHEHPGPAPQHPNSSRYQRIVDKFMEAGATGVSVTVISPEGTWNGVGGMADVQNKIVMTPGHTLRIGSMTKMFTAAAILKLQEEGILNIKDKISKYIPAIITNRISNANEVTIEQCLNHTSGIRNYISDEVINGYINGSIVKYEAARTLQFIYDKPATDPPGQGRYYSNSNYLLLSLVISHVTGKPSYRIVTDKIITPLRLQNTFASTILPPTLTKSYFREKDKEGDLQDVTHIDNNFIGGEDALDGGIIASSQDIANFLQALLTGKILSQTSMNLMKTYRPIDPDNFGNDPDMAYYKEYGLGLMKLATDQGEALGHDGNVYGFNGKAYYLPAQKVTMVILLNYVSPDRESKVMKTLNVKETFNLLF